MKPLPIYRWTVATAAIVTSTTAFAQSAPAARDAQVEQSIQDTVAASLKRRGYTTTDPKTIATHTAVRQAITNATNAGGAASGIASTGWSWAETIRGLIADVASGFTWPLSVGKSGTKPFEGGGTFGGGGADGSWDVDCDDLKIELDSAGNLIVPSYSLQVGLQLKYVNTAMVMHKVNNSATAASGQAAQRWAMHSQINGSRAPIDWYGVVGPTSATCTRFATVAYRNGSNVLVPRVTTDLCTGSYTMLNNPAFFHSGYTEIECPQMNVDGASFHFYGASPGWSNAHNHECTMFAPDINGQGEAGYFINKRTSVVFNGATWPATLPEGWKACKNDPTFLRRLADAFFKKATGTAGTVPYVPIQDTDVRDTSNVNDLSDNPTTGTRPDPNPTNVDAPQPTPPPPPPPPTTIDLGTDPNIGTPSDPTAPTNIMDPVFDWLPDLPSIELNTAGAQCPTWSMQPFQGPEWTLVMDKHCPFIADNAALISTIMILGFTIGSAMIILRA